MGPFSKYLTEQAQPPPTPQPAGAESPLAGAVYIGKNFLDGMRQSRLQKAAQAEMENEKVQRAHEQVIEALQKDQNLDPRVKQHYLGEAQKRYAQMIAGVKETSRDTGHPFTDVVKNMAINAIGGEMPSKKQPLDMNFIGEVFTTMQDPAYHRSTRLGQLNARAAEFIKTGNAGSAFTNQRDLLTNPNSAGLVQEYRALSGSQDGYPDAFGLLAKDPVSAAQQNYTESRWQSRAQGSQQATQPGQTVPTTAPPPIGNIFMQMENDRLMQEQDSKLGIPADIAIPKPGPSKTYLDPATNTRFEGVKLDFPYKGSPAGVYNAANPSAPIKGAIPSNNANPDANHTYEVKGNTLGPEYGNVTYLVDRRTNKVIGAVKDENGNLILDFGTTQRIPIESTDLATGNVTQNIVSFGKKPIPAGLVASTQTTQTAPPPTSNTSALPTPRSATAAPAPQAAQTQHTARGGSVKKPGLVPEPKTLQSMIDEGLSGVTPIEELHKRLGNDGLSIKKLNDGIASQGKPLNKVTSEKIANLRGVTEEFIPAYQRMVSLLSKEKNPQVQYVNGMLSTKFTNPELNEAIDSVRSRISTLAKTIGGEQRVTDADAERMMGFGPSKLYTAKHNKEILGRFRTTLGNTIESMLPGISDEQKEKIANGHGGILGKIILERVAEKRKSTQPKQAGDTPAVKVMSVAPIFRRKGASTPPPAKAASPFDQVNH